MSVDVLNLTQTSFGIRCFSQFPNNSSSKSSQAKSKTRSKK